MGWTGIGSAREGSAIEPDNNNGSLDHASPNALRPPARDE